MKYAVEQRLRFIDFLLHQYGYLNRSALIDYFGISMPQATKDITAYRALAPDNIEYSLTDKMHKRTKKFKRYWQ